MQSVTGSRSRPVEGELNFSHSVRRKGRLTNSIRVGGCNFHFSNLVEALFTTHVQSVLTPTDIFYLSSFRTHICNTSWARVSWSELTIVIHHCKRWSKFQYQIWKYNRVCSHESLDSRIWVQEREQRSRAYTESQTKT